MEHLNDLGVTYSRHWLFAFQFGMVLILVGLCVVVHAFCPWWFKTTGSDAIKSMHNALEE